MNLSLYCLQKEVRVAAAAQSVSNAMSLVKNFELFEDNARRSHRQATATGTHSLINQSINQSTFVKRHKSRANRRRVKKKARPSGYRMLWQKVPSLKHV